MTHTIREVALAIGVAWCTSYNRSGHAAGGILSLCTVDTAVGTVGIALGTLARQTNPPYPLSIHHSAPSSKERVRPEDFFVLKMDIEAVECCMASWHTFMHKLWAELYLKMYEPTPSRVCIPEEY